ncbi:unnamed protein product [Protopolystoma xenopodis]|uniref:Uncharacterized protein n=1 Tax=Protopolystoma xenopodis TaxID=117903 RepID=A0A3S5A6D4_9PLAT|nr:unnamed protein product [Protopolystoma xenopodis]
MYTYNEDWERDAWLDGNEEVIDEHGQPDMCSDQRNCAKWAVATWRLAHKIKSITKKGGELKGGWQTTLAPESYEGFKRTIFGFTRTMLAVSCRQAPAPLVCLRFYWHEWFR